MSAHFHSYLCGRKAAEWLIEMEYPKRKHNRLPDYDYSTEGTYFVTVCTQDRMKVLGDIVGDGFPVLKSIGCIAEEWIRQLSDKYSAVTVDKYVIMPDHIHMLLRVDCSVTGASPTLGNVMGWYKYQVTKQVYLEFQTQRARLFQRSYYDHVIRNQQDYNDIWEYIDNNPKKWIVLQRGIE